MSRCSPQMHVYAWDANDCGPPPEGLPCRCGARRFMASDETRPLPDWLRRNPNLAEGFPDGRCQRCRYPWDDHEGGTRCP